MISTEDVCDDFGLSTLASFDNVDFSSAPLAPLAADDGTPFENSSTGASPMLGEASTAHAKSSDPLLYALTSSYTSDHLALHHTNQPYASTPQSHQTAHSKTKERSMVKLSEIIIRLFDQLTTISDSSFETLSPPSQHSNIAGSLSAYNDCKERMTLVGEVFCKSQELIQVLESFEPISGAHEPSTTVIGPNAGIQSHSSSKTQLDTHSPDPSCSPSSSLMEFGNSKPSMTPACSAKSVAGQTGYDSLSCTGADFLLMPYSPSRTEFELDPLTNLDSSTLLQMDIPIMILVVTCHNRLIRIYNALFTRYIRILKDYPSAADRLLLPEILPSLDLGGFKPPTPRSLQISIIVETSLCMMSQIEHYLERPDRNGSDRPGTQAHGPQLMDLVTNEDGSGLLEDGGYSRQLRENTKAIKRLINKGPN